MNGCLQGNILQYYPKMGTIDPYLHIFGAYSGNFDQTFFWKIECPTFAWGAPTTLGITLIDALNLSRLVPSICSFLHYTDWLCWLCFGLTKKKVSQNCSTVCIFHCCVGKKKLCYLLNNLLIIIDTLKDQYFGGFALLDIKGSREL